MPSRRRRRQPTSAHPTAGSTPGSTLPPDAGEDPVSQFGRLLRESAEREEAAAAESERRRADARAKRRAADERAGAIDAARRDLDRAIAGVRRAKADRRGEQDADATWRAAKARLIELETGEAPEWAATESPDDASLDGPDEADDGETTADAGEAATDAPDE